MQENALNDAVQKIKGQLNIVNVIGSFISLKKKGNKYWGCCPFHNEKTPSFTVDENKGFYYCFGCHVGGDAIKFLMEIRKIPFIDVIKDLAEQYNIPLPNDYEGKKNLVKPVDPLELEIIKMHELAKEFYANKLQSKTAEAAAALAYLRKRNINQEIIKRFSLGLSSEAWQELNDLLQKNNFAPDNIRESGLVSISQSGNAYDKFRQRIIIPIFNSKGETIAFGGRVLQDNIQPKYLNSPESRVFSKRQTLYALHIAKDSIRKAGYSILTEGYMDTISMHVHGFTNTVASLGTAFTTEQARLLGRQARKVLFAYDNDTAGIQATIRGINIAREAFLNVAVLDLSPAKDPDEFLNKFGATELEKRIKNEYDPISFQIEQTIKLDTKDGSLQEKVSILNKVLQFVTHLDNSLEIDTYLNQIATLLVIDLAIVQSEYGKAKGVRGAHTRTMQPRLNAPVPSKLNALASAQRYIIKVSLEDVSILEYVNELIKPSDFPDALFAEIFMVVCMLNAESKLSEDNLLRSLDGDAHNQVISIMAEETELKNTVKLVDDCIKQIMYHNLKKKFDEHTRLAIEYERAGNEQFITELKAAQEIKNQLKEYYFDNNNN